MIEHTSVNPNKALHIGHLRNAVLGDSLRRFFESIGYRTVVLNYIDDTGSQVADIILGFYLLKIPEDPKKFDLDTSVKNIVEFLKKENLYKEGIENEIRRIFLDRMSSLKSLYGYEIPEKFDQYCGDFVYYVVNKLYEVIPELEKYKNNITKMIEENEDMYDYLKRIVYSVLKDQLKTLFTFDIYYDYLIKESDVLRFKLWDDAFEILKERNIIKFEEEGEKKGCWIIDLSNWKEFEGYSDKKKVLIRSDGTTVYLAKDIAFAFWKLGIIDKDFRYSLFLIQPNGKELLITEKYGNIQKKIYGDISINVIGSEQSYLQLIIKKIVESLNANKEYIHYGYGLVMLSGNTAKIFGISDEIVRMSGRKGVYINADYLYEKVLNVVKEKLKDRNLDEDTLKKIARSIISFEILRYDRNSTMIFDIDRMLSFEEGNALYLMYTYARINSLLKKYGKDIKFEITEINEYERELLKQIFKFRDILKEIEKNLEINKLIDYTVNLCKKYNEFYQNVPILPEVDKYPHRIYLSFLTKQILEFIFKIIKIDLIERI